MNRYNNADDVLYVLLFSRCASGNHALTRDFHVHLRLTLQYVQYIHTYTQFKMQYMCTCNHLQ